MEISFYCNSVAGDRIATKFCTCQDSTAVVPCAKFCSDHFIRIWMTVKWNLHRIWIVMKKLLMKWAPGSHSTDNCSLSFSCNSMSDHQGPLLLTWYYFSVHENHRTCQTFPMARPKCLMRDFRNLNRIYKAHRTNVWWTKPVFQLHCYFKPIMYK